QKVVIVATMTNHYRYRKEIVVTDNVLTAAFQADQTNYCETAVVNFTDMSTANPQAWEWTFEGGSPATSTERNPQGITYSTPGQYNVTLKVTKGTEVNEITLPAYIVVSAYPVAPVVTNAGVCVGQENATLVAEGVNVRWYSDEALTNMVGEGNTYVSKETLPGVYTYYVTATNDICQSAASTATFTIAEY
ncbi:MAG TPA: PKD domain-containing protein, partial [Bacteroidales bacterium]|nr:PKD domain-containing protein [Bacteroidales bacterium]